MALRERARMLHLQENSMRRCSPAGLSLFLLGPLLAPLSLAGCSSSSSGGGATDPAATTVLVYVLGTDLESGRGVPGRGGNATNSIKEMMDVGSTANMKVVVQTGGASKNKDRKPADKNNMQPDEIDWTHVQRYLVNKGSLALVANGDLGAEAPKTKVDMGSATTLQDFVTWGVETYPASKYIVVLWAHGGGVNGGISEDEITGSSMTVPQISAALEAASNEGSVVFEIIGFDACLMATAEVAASLNSSSNYMVASQDTIPGTSWAYIPFLNYVAGHPSASGRDIGRAIADSYEAKCLTKTTGGWIPMDNPTLSVIDLSKMDALSNATNAFATRLATYLDLDPNLAIEQRTAGWKQIAQARARSLDWSTSAFFGKSFDLVDMGTFVSKVVNNIYKNIGPDDLLVNAELTLSNAIQDAVVYNIRQGSNSSATGLSVYFPSILAGYDKDYPSNTSTSSGSPFFAGLYTNGRNGMVQTYFKDYEKNLSALQASVQWNSATSPLAATINNDFDYALAAHYRSDCTYYTANASTTGACYDGMQLVQSFTPISKGVWGVDFTYGSRWPYLAGSAATPYPVVMLPDQAAGTQLGNFSSYLVPAFSKDVDKDGKVTYTAGYLAVEEVYPPEGGSASYRFNGFRADALQAATLSPLVNGEVYAVGVYASVSGGFTLLRSSNEVTVAGGTLRMSSGTNAGGDFAYCVVDLTGSIQWSATLKPYTPAN
jgi:hypothetical protein